MPSPAAILSETLLDETSVRWYHGRITLRKLLSVSIGLSCVMLLIFPCTHGPTVTALGPSSRFLSRASDKQRKSVQRPWRLHRADLDNSTLGEALRDQVWIAMGPPPSALATVPARQRMTLPTRGMPTTRAAGCFHPNQLPFKQFERINAASNRLRSFAVASSPEAYESVIEPDMEVRWGPMLDETLEDTEPRKGSLTMPVFPVTGPVLPYTSHTLFIYEPRYRAMYDDILSSGSRRFVVCQVDEKTGRLSEIGAVFYLEDLKELSQLTNDTLKYAGRHMISGRVKLLRVLNPRMFSSRETYLRAEVADIVDTDLNEDTSEAEATVRILFREVVDLQLQLGEEPRFNETAKSLFDFGRGTGSHDQGLWGTMRKWQAFLKDRAVIRDQKMWSDFQHETRLLLKSKGFDLAQMLDEDGENAFKKLPSSVRELIEAMRHRYYERIEQSDDDGATAATQAMLQSRSHAERLAIFLYVLNEERKRLAVCKSLESMFKTPAVGKVPL